MKRRLFFLFVLLAIVNVSWAAQTSFESGLQQNQLIELYTSEGCSSCPPAESYLNHLEGDPRLWKDFVPLAFHVDYWNNLGWRDRFSTPAYTRRQRDYANFWRARTVYTPEFFVNGHEWRRWSGKTLPVNQQDNIGNLKVKVNGKQLQASFKPVSPVPDDLVLHVALLGMDRKTNIRAGENAGRHATHQFVVLGYKAVNSDQLHWKTQLPRKTIDEPGRQAIAVWLTRPDMPVALQATGALLPDAAY